MATSPDPRDAAAGPPPEGSPAPEAPAEPAAADPFHRPSEDLPNDDGPIAGGGQPDFAGLEIPVIERPAPGTPPGLTPEQIAKLPSLPGDVHLTCVDYSPERLHAEKIEDIEDFLVQLQPDWSRVRWINVDGLTDMEIVRALAEKHGLHPLAVEDVLHVGQRPKIETFPHDRHCDAPHFLIARMIQLQESRLLSEQISVFLGERLVITFQETHGDVWDPIRQRLQQRTSRIRQSDSGFLVYSLLDAIVDHCFPILEHFADQLLEIEEKVLERPEDLSVREIHAFNRELMLLRRHVWPMREVIIRLEREPDQFLMGSVKTYLRDVVDHVVQVIDMIETYREIAVSMAETYTSTIGNKLNEVMKVLTIVTTIFVPLTFLAGVYGMNFHFMPEIHGNWGYPWMYPIGFWTLCLGVAVTMLWWFRKRKWL